MYILTLLITEVLAVGDFCGICGYICKKVEIPRGSKPPVLVYHGALRTHGRDLYPPAGRVAL